VSKIPVLGGLFGVNREQERHIELAIFVTPIIVDPQDPGLSSRVANMQGILQDSFSDPPKLNTPIHDVKTIDQWESYVESIPAGTSSASQWE
jgi:type II secretory pathway component GspD/PulD (secretin)